MRELFCWTWRWERQVEAKRCSRRSVGGGDGGGGVVDQVQERVASAFASSSLSLSSRLEIEKATLGPRPSRLISWRARVALQGRHFVTLGRDGPHKRVLAHAFSWHPTPHTLSLGRFYALVSAGLPQEGKLGN